MHQLRWRPARVARWGGVLLGVLMFACGPAPEGERDARLTTVPEPVTEPGLPPAPHEKPEAVREAAWKSAGVSNPFDVSRPALRARPTASTGVGVAFDGKQYFVVWEDTREGGVFGARVRPDGRILDPGGIPLNLGTGLDGGEPRVAWDGKYFTVVWEGSGGVFGAHVESDGDVRRHFIFSSSDELYGPVGLACAKGVCLVVYGVSGDAEDVLVFDRVESDGDVLDGGLLTPVPAEAFFPAVAWDGKQFAVVWHDERGGFDSEDIYGARVTKGGTVLDPGGVPIITLPGAQRAPGLTWTGDRFLLVWQDDRGGTEDVYGARLRRDLTVSGPEGFAISTGAGDQTRPQVAPSGSKSLVVWDDTRLGLHRIRGARVGDDGSVWDPAGFTVSSGDEETEELPAVAAGNHQFFVAFAGAEAGVLPFGSHHILGTRVQHDTTVKDSPALRFTRSAYEQGQSALAFGAGTYLAVWREERDGVPRLMATRVRPDGRVLDVPFTLPAGADPRDPAVAWDGDVFLVVWEEGEFAVGTGTDIRGARVSGSGLLLDAASIAIAELPEDQFSPAVASNLDDFLVVWTDRRGSFFGNASDIVGARVSSGGTVLDPGGFSISGVDFTQQAASVVATGDLRYLVAWVHLDFTSIPGGSERSLRGARVAADGSVLDIPELLIDEGPVYIAPPGLAWDGTNTLVAWTSAPEGGLGSAGPDVAAVRVSAAGTVLEASPRLVATGAGYNRTNITAAFDGTDFWLAWEQSTAAPFFPQLVYRSDVYGARVRTDGTVRDPGGRAISAHQPEPEYAPALAAFGGRALVLYTEFVTEEDVMNLRIQGRVLTGFGSSAMEVAEPEAGAAR